MRVCCTYRTAKRKEQIGDAWFRSTTEFHEACVVAGTNGDEEPHFLGACSAFCAEPFNYLGLDDLIVETLPEV